MLAVAVLGGCASAARWLTPAEIKQSAAAVEAYLEYDLRPDLEGDGPFDKHKHRELSEPVLGNMRAINDYLAGRKARGR